MSPIEYIAEGIRQGNWETVCEGYERLTGEALPIPTTVATTNGAEEVLRQIVDLAASIVNGPADKLSENIAEICEKIAKPAKRKPGRPKGSGKKKAKKKTTVTKDGEDASLQFDDSNKTVVQKTVGTIQLITNDPDPEEVAANKAKAAKAGKNKLNLNRQITKTYEVKCNECEQPFQSNRPKGEMGQKCSKCLSDLKSRFV